MQADLPENEAARLLALRAAAVLDSPAEPGFDRIVKLAQMLSGCPIALVSLVDADRQWFKACIGLDVCETPREVAFCAHAILGRDVFWIADAQRDVRFADSPLVLGPPHIRFYAGAPIILPGDLAVGTVCVIDTAPRPYDAALAAALVELAGMVTDLFALRAAAQALKASDDQYRTVITTMSEGVVMQKRSGEIIACNPAAERILGLTADQLMGRTSGDPRWRAHKPDGSDYPGSEHPAMQCLETGQPIEGAVMGLTLPTGEQRWIQINAHPIFGDDGAPDMALTTFSDITAQRLLQHDLQVERGRAQQASIAKSQFLANMSHEIRTPLNGVVGITGALRHTELSAEQAEMVELIRDSGQLLERLLHDILDLSKIEAGALQLEAAPFDLEHDIASITQLFRAKADEKALDIHIDIDPSARGWFVGDGMRIKQIAANLLSNAIKFTAHGSVRLALRCDDHDHAQVPVVQLMVTDTGIGFDEGVTERLLQRFEQADGTITRTYGGTGLGLSIVKHLVDLMGGEMVVSSRPEVGSTFEVRLPLPRAEMAADEAAPAVQVTLDGMRVLVAEDHEVNQKVVNLILSSLGAEATFASNGLEALQMFRDGGFDLVLMDMQMPVMDGLLATQAIRAYEREMGMLATPIAMLSANAMTEHKAQSSAAGADHHITKPITPESLTQGIIQTFERFCAKVSLRHVG